MNRSKKLVMALISEKLNIKKRKLRGGNHNKKVQKFQSNTITNFEITNYKKKRSLAN